MKQDGELTKEEQETWNALTKTYDSDAGLSASFVYAPYIPINMIKFEIHKGIK